MTSSITLSNTEIETLADLAVQLCGEARRAPGSDTHAAYFRQRFLAGLADIRSITEQAVQTAAQGILNAGRHCAAEDVEVEAAVQRILASERAARGAR